MLPDILRFEPLMMERPWGGRRLEAFGRTLPPSVRAGESWEIADLDPEAGSSDPRCTCVADGPLAGASLTELVARFGVELLGTARPTPDGRFPLLVKLLDAREHLSVQVHPPDELAETDPAIRAKSESWYVIEAEPSSVVWFDVRSDVELDDLRAVEGTPGVLPMLGEIPARAGDFHHIPAGRVHALGAGVMVLEIQTPSDTTFRIYDWDDVYARPPRELHPDQAMRSIVRDDPLAISVAGSSGPGRRELVRTADYWVREHRSEGGLVQLDPRPELRVLTVIRGTVSAGSVVLGRGDIRVLPAASPLIGAWQSGPDTVLIETGLV